ncbi:MAG: glycoside hydrolase family 55 protein [Flavobacteriales bacterium]|jgi:hypothetical protein|nr:glycoside hydrolase family 55 protein [Flavobacteriales bacterium]
MKHLFVSFLYFFLSYIYGQTPIHVSQFGAVGDGTTNDYTAIQAAIDSAAQTGSKVLFSAKTYAIDNTLKLYGGVNLIGEGKGATATSTPFNGTVIKNIGTKLTVKITGHNAGLHNLTIYDTDNAGAAGGVKIIANNSDIESIILKSVLIFGFTDTFALKLKAKNGGGISYCSFYDLRIRHAKIGIHIDEDESSYVNSNSFYHGAISGGGFDYCFLAEGGNNNIINAMIMEPYTSIKGHFVVKAGEVIGNDIRIEGAQQPQHVPLVEFKAGTKNSILNGTYSGGLTIDNGDNTILFKSGKSLGYHNPNSNLFINSSLKGTANNTIPYWEIGNTAIVVKEVADEIYTNQEVIELTIPPGITSYLRPSPTFLPKVLSNSKYETVNFGAFIKTDKSDIITTICKAPSGTATSLYHPGNDQWQLIGMTSAISATIPYDPKFYIDNSSSSDSTKIYLTSPTLNFGITPPKIEAAPITTSGGILNGTLSNSITAVSTPTSTFLTLPNSGNIFEVNGTNTIARINHLSNDRMPKGTVITLLFNNAGTSLVNGAYIKLLTGYTSTLNSSITLISNGDGTWREMNRNL